jgi:predicted metallo-beta-lactamase superfamily hydrolase
MKVVPLAFESLGVRSMCTYVETSDVRITIDPGAALGLRYKLEPHQKEIEKHTELMSRISESAARSDVLTISHYHYDHHTPDADFWADKVLLIKHPEENINKSQKERAKYFLKRIGDTPRSVEFADGREFDYGSTIVRFSKAVPHGKEGSKLGFVTMLTIETPDSKFMHCSDVAGPLYVHTGDIIIDENPDLLILEGPPTYLMGWRLSWRDLQKAEENLTRILDHTDTKTIFLDHHLLREKFYRRRLSSAYRHAEAGDKKIISAAEYLGRDPLLLEAYRKELYDEATENDVIKKHKIDMSRMLAEEE